MYRVEAIWLKIVGVLLIVLGLVLFASPYVSYTTREHIERTPLTVKRERTISVPHAVAILVTIAGIAVFAIASRPPRQ